MKKLTYIIITLFFLGTGCSKDFLEVAVPVKRSIENFYKTPEDFKAALIDNYNVLQREMLTNPRFVFGDIASDDALKGGESIGDWPDMEQFVEFQPRSTNAFINGLWTNSYQAIAKANLIITQIDSTTGVTDESLKKRIRAEAQFLRSFNYLYIAMAFGDAPLLTKGISDFKQIDNKMLKRAPVSAIWNLIENDMNEAIPNLPTRAALSAADYGRATKGAAQALLAKALTFQRKYDSAIPVLKDLIENGGYSLMNDYGALFRPEGEFSSENIFEVNFIKQDAGWAEDCEGSIRIVYQMSRDDWGWGFNQPTQDLVNEFEPGDPRIIYTVNFPKDKYATSDGTVEEKNSQNNPYGYHSRKVFALPSERPNSASCAGQNEVIFRLADMYLLYAESLVLASAKDEATARYYVNLVRNRAAQTPKVDPERAFQQHTVEPVTLAPLPSGLTGQPLLEAIWHERRVELAMEGHRWWDLVRQNRTSLLNTYYQNWSVAKGFEAKGDLKGKFYNQWVSTIKRNDYPVMPVPQTDVDQSNGNLEQTIGY